MVAHTAPIRLWLRDILPARKGGKDRMGKPVNPVRRFHLTVQPKNSDAGIGDFAVGPGNGRTRGIVSRTPLPAQDSVADCRLRRATERARAQRVPRGSSRVGHSWSGTSQLRRSRLLAILTDSRHLPEPVSPCPDVAAERLSHSLTTAVDWSLACAPNVVSSKAPRRRSRR